MFESVQCSIKWCSTHHYFEHVHLINRHWTYFKHFGFLKKIYYIDSNPFQELLIFSNFYRKIPFFYQGNCSMAMHFRIGIKTSYCKWILMTYFLLWWMLKHHEVEIWNSKNYFHAFPSNSLALRPLLRVLHIFKFKATQKQRKGHYKKKEFHCPKQKLLRSHNL